MAERPPIDQKAETTGEKVLIRRARVGSVDIYEVKDTELDLLEKGSPATIQFNFAIFLLSIAASSIFALCTTKEYKYPISEILFAVIAVVGILLGGYLFIIWWKTRQSISATVKIIRERMPNEECISPETLTPIPLLTPQDDQKPSNL